ncbi:MAG: DNA-protecting protein DprA [Magnetococcales bacterium]|nr:DNA-protecting protein DprA [Magnetococcales bacterium]
MHRSTLIDWLRLAKVPGLGPVRIGLLLRHFHHPGGILSASAAALDQIPGLPARVRAGLRQAGRPEQARDAASEMERLTAMGIRILARGDPAYPTLLEQIHDPPVLLFVLGDPAHLVAPRPVAVVGTRSPSGPGLRTARNLAREMAGQGLTVVSGLAVGIDTAAHQGALEGGGTTVAVVATGLDVDYPRPNQDLKKRILQQGCVVTEAPLGTAPAPYLFPPRNRIISGLSRGVVVVEARTCSGSLVTVGQALEQGREVFAVPGPADDPRYQGCHQLLRDGARLVTGVNDILEELHWSLGRIPVASAVQQTSRPPEDTPPQAAAILEQLVNGPMQGDQLARSCRLTVAVLSRILLQLELAGVVERAPGNMYSLKGS